MYLYYLKYNFILILCKHFKIIFTLFIESVTYSTNYLNLFIENS